MAFDREGYEERKQGFRLLSHLISKISCETWSLRIEDNVTLFYSDPSSNLYDFKKTGNAIQWAIYNDVVCYSRDEWISGVVYLVDGDKASTLFKLTWMG